MEKRIVILGAGPTGLGAAYRLRELGYRNWLIYEKNDYIGGLAASFKDDQGFTWDIGGHVMFSHYKYFDDVVDKLLGDDYLEHQRESWIRMLQRWVPYPLQNNIRHLPKEAVLECLVGLHEAARNTHEPARNFHEWILSTFGEGIAKHFMFPYNKKLWRTPLDKMDKSWIAERVSVVDFEKALNNVILAKDDTGWGPNNVFKFPLKNGTGGLFGRFLPYIEDNLRIYADAVKIDLEQKRIWFADGATDTYDILINTSPLDSLIGKSSAPEEVRQAAGNLISNSVYVVGVGLDKKLQSSKCWIYFPDSSAPFYRVTQFSNYSPFNVPSGDRERFSSFMCETSFSKDVSVGKETIIEKTVKGLIDNRMMEPGDEKLIAGTYLIEVDRAYPVPTIGRDRALTDIQDFLHANSVYSRGRFGAWRYEIGNMDHSVMMGAECVGSILNGEKEAVFES
ncbi:MAG: NAD(P)-binding protein [Actinomycetota bacterium]|nr:NAD(P)-binding protein [Actinomycetota bacterium]